MKITKAYAVSMTYEVSDEEKHQAEKALIFFNHAIKVLEIAKDHLNIMKTPFKDNPEIESTEIMKVRAAMRRFRDKSIENFNDFKREAFKCVNIIQSFESDTQIVKLIKSFIASIDELEDKVNKFSGLFDDLESKSFSKDVVGAIESVQGKCEEIEEIIDDRIKTHIQTNILATSWIDSVSKNYELKIEKKTPLIMELFNKRQDQLNDAIVNKRIS
jgi:hypothetical protein